VLTLHRECPFAALDTGGYQCSLRNSGYRHTQIAHPYISTIWVYCREKGICQHIIAWHREMLSENRMDIFLFLLIWLIWWWFKLSIYLGMFWMFTPALLNQRCWPVARNLSVRSEHGGLDPRWRPSVVFGVCSPTELGVRIRISANPQGLRYSYYSDTSVGET
jgi:hypothetical protein